MRILHNRRFYLGLDHADDCAVHTAHVEKVERSHADARRYCTCTTYDRLRTAAGPETLAKTNRRY